MPHATSCTTLHSIDSTAVTEPEGLTASHPCLRPAVVLTGAFHNGHLEGAPFADQLEAAGVEYVPFAVSCWGRLHTAALQMLSNAAKRIARRDGTCTHRAVLQRLTARITTAIMRRAARMVLRCFPTFAGEEAEIVRSD